MVVYVDLIFLLNLLIDAAILQTTAWCRRIKPSWWRLWLAAAMGAAYVILIFFPEMSVLFTFVVKCAISLAMIFVAFGFRSLQFYVGHVAVFYMVNFAAAGGMIGLHYVMQSSGEVMNGLMFTQSGGTAFQVEISTVFIVASIVPAIVFFRKVWTAMRRRETITQYRAEVEVRMDGYSIACTGLIDTGNQLTDPLTRTPVIVMEVQCWSHIFSPYWVACIERSRTDEIMEALDEDNAPWHHRLRFVPYRGIHNGTQFMLALKPDEVIITQGTIAYRATKVLVGIRGGKLSAEGAYQAILHPGLMEGTGVAVQTESIAGTGSSEAGCVQMT